MKGQEAEGPARQADATFDARVVGTMHSRCPGPAFAGNINSLTNVYLSPVRERMMRVPPAPHRPARPSFPSWPSRAGRPAGARLVRMAKLFAVYQFGW